MVYESYEVHNSIIASVGAAILTYCLPKDCFAATLLVMTAKSCFAGLGNGLCKEAIMSFPPEIKNFVDDEGRLKQWPSKRSIQLVALEYIAQEFEVERKYTEPEVNIILGRKHTFNDAALLRRSLIELGHLKRTNDCKAYWRPKK